MALHVQREIDLSRWLLILAGLSLIEIEYKFKRTTPEIEGVSFRYDNIAFKGSEIDRKFSFGNLKKVFDKNIEALKQTANESILKIQINPKIGGIELTNEQLEKLKSSNYIYLENMSNTQNDKLFSAYIVTDDQLTKALFFKNPTDTFVKYSKYEMRVMDKARIESGFITKAKVKWYGGGFAYPYLWKTNKSDTGYKENWGDPRIKEAKKEEKGKQTIIPKVKEGKRPRMR